MARDRAGFGASEEQRAFDQAMAAGQFGSGEQNRAFNTQMAGAQFGNQARQQSLQEMLALRNQPINEISALMSGGQVSLPNVPQYNALATAPDLPKVVAICKNEEWRRMIFTEASKPRFPLGHRPAGRGQPPARAFTHTRLPAFTPDGCPGRRR